MSTPRLEDFALPPPPAGGPGWPPAARAAVGCGAGCAAAVVLTAFAAWLLVWLALTVSPAENGAPGNQVPPTPPPAGAATPRIFPGAPAS
jgi:hypothetical protein